MSMIRDIVDSVFSPTTKPQAGVIKAMNLSFYGLFATLLMLAWATSWNVHVIALTVVSIALFASISWFIIELGKVEKEQPASISEPSRTSDSVPSSTSSATSTSLPVVDASLSQRPKSAAGPQMY